MEINISSSVLNRYPKTTIGYVIAEVKDELEQNYVESLKKKLYDQLVIQGITQKNLTTHTHINEWRNVYRDYGVELSKFRSFIEALVRRIIRGQELWQVSSVVDLYNCVSVLTLFLIGGYDFSKIVEDISLRYGRPQEVFIPLGSSETIPVNKKQVVYADNNKILCYLWNYKDSRLSAIDLDTKKAIFFLDSAFIPQVFSMEEAVVKSLLQHLTQIGGIELASGVLDAKKVSIKL